MNLLRWLTLACAILVPFLQREIDARLGAFRAQEEILYVWSGDHLRRMFPGFETVLADLYWLRTIQYYGGQRAFAANQRYDLLEPLTRITVTLDPKFNIAYRYGATFLAEPYPGGAGKPETAVALLRLGVENNPDAWLIWQSLGVFQYHFLKDAKGAAAALTSAQQRPGAPDWLGTLAAQFLRKEGDRDAARDIWRSLYERSENGAMRENARVNIQRLDALDVIEELNRRVARYRAGAGELPRGWEDLARARLVGRQPIDPSGTPFDYDPENGVFAISRKSELWFVQ